MTLLLEFYAFLKLYFLFALIAVVVGNFITGTVLAVKNKEWRLDAMIDGFLGIVFSAVGYLTIGVFAFLLIGLDILGISFTPVFVIIVGLAILYKGNSLFINSVHLMGLPTPKILDELDAKIKELFQESQINKFVTGIQSYEVDEEIEELRAEGTSVEEGEVG